jgi:DNA-binding response OmpR family regulator
LKINGNAQFDVLATLWAAKGNIVPYLDLCKAIDEKRFSSEVQSTKKAPPELREIVTFIHQALRANDIPIRIKAIRGLGYRLLNADE